MKTNDFYYDLPADRIAQEPIEPRDHARLMVLRRHNHYVEHTFFYEIGKYLESGDLLVINDTKVIPARLYGKKANSGGKVEVLLLKKIDQLSWQCLVGGKHIRVNQQINFGEELTGVILTLNERAERVIQFNQPIEPFLTKIGNTPLPP
ncbi:MAG: S-adenosylmethionine:tRNA ribosyltransferase-isomerase, partial [Anaerolineales bacterium]